MNPLAFLACPVDAKVNSMAGESPQAKKCRCPQWMVNQWDMAGYLQHCPQKRSLAISENSNKTLLDLTFQAKKAEMPIDSYNNIHALSDLGFKYGTKIQWKPKKKEMRK